MNEQPYIETAKEVAGKAIGRHGLIYITIIVAMGVGASIVLEESKMAAVMGLSCGRIEGLRGKTTSLFVVHVLRSGGA